uniref:Ricin B-type lectin domain-containing protein n=1 Tax=Macrostomum lignano TaxID=282301 RepID=A0A1I8F2I2_9PLAT
QRRFRPLDSRRRRTAAVTASRCHRRSRLDPVGLCDAKTVDQVWQPRERGWNWSWSIWNTHDLPLTRTTADATKVDHSED